MDDLLTFAIMLVLAFVLLTQVDRKWQQRKQLKRKPKLHRINKVHHTQ